MSQPTPKCCGVDSVLVTINPRVSYFYCRECKNEVKENELELTNQDIDYLNGGPRPVIGIANETIHKGDFVVMDDRGLLQPRIGTRLPKRDDPAFFESIAKCPNCTKGAFSVRLCEFHLRRTDP